MSFGADLPSSPKNSLGEKRGLGSCTQESAVPLDVTVSNRLQLRQQATLTFVSRTSLVHHDVCIMDTNRQVGNIALFWTDCKHWKSIPDRMAGESSFHCKGNSAYGEEEQGGVSGIDGGYGGQEKDNLAP
ncbi:hypothetical protein TURU_057846 [Turdus rufiventris]|nr:hypothetical protein TURU_057846 [Turdus rufiventris]